MNGEPQLLGRRILLTGASGGIGSVVAENLAAKGAVLVLVGRRDDALRALSARLIGGPHEVIALDVADADAWQAVRGRIAPDGILHGLVTAAGVLTPVGPIETIDIGEFSRTISVNLIGTLLAITSSLEALASSGGAIVTFSGGGATAPFPRFDAYAASKAAVVRLTENLAVELAERGVRVNAVAPGFILSAMHDSTVGAGPDLVGASYYERTRAAIADGTGDDPILAADLVAFLLADASTGITGKLISAKWDPWHDLQFCERLRNEPDLATLRRIDDKYFMSSGATSR